ncbi:MAG: hypothetical protein AB7U73_13495 [Pirellulales bacterium]
MSKTKSTSWERLRTDETRELEEMLRNEFDRVDAYRYNSASIRVRVIDPRFEGKTVTQRDAMVERVLKRLPPSTQADIVNLLTLAPSEMNDRSRLSFRNFEFEDPSPSQL